MSDATPGAAPARPARNLADLVRASARDAPDRPALEWSSGAMTWAELDGRVDALATGLAGRGCRDGARVALALGNTPEFVVGYFATLRAGAVAVPLNPGNTPDELAHQLSDCGACALLATPAVAERVAPMGDDLPALQVVAVGAGEPPPGTQPLAELEVTGAARVEPVRGAEDPAVLLYTSGTSGRPRAAILTHRALLANIEQVSAIPGREQRDDEVFLLVLPLFHVYGLNSALGMVARHAATGVLVERFDPVDTLRVIREHRVTNVVGAPPMYVAWSMLPETAEAFRAVRLAVSGAAPLPPSVLEAMRELTGVPVYEGYGLTEAAPTVTTTFVSGRAKPGSIGRPVPGVEVRLVDEAGEPPEEGDPGEIVIRGANLFSGYWPDGEGGPDADGWFRTGDVAYADADGDLHIVDRLRELILVSGFNVYPREVEDVLESHPDVAEAAVIGVPHPYTGESVKALVVRRAGSRLSADDVIEHAAHHLARFKCPTVVEFVDELPHSGAGKVAKGRLRVRP